jgi:hypothetical protein
MPCARRAPFATPPPLSIQLTVISVCGRWSRVSHGSAWPLPAACCLPPRTLPFRLFSQNTCIGRLVPSFACARRLAI